MEPQAKAQREPGPPGGAEDGWRATGGGRETLLSNPELPWQRSPVRLKTSPIPHPPTQCPTSGGRLAVSQTEVGWDGRELMRAVLSGRGVARR